MSGVYFEKKHVLIISDEPRILAEIKMWLIELFEVSIAAAGGAALAVLETYDTAAVVIHIGESREKAFTVFSGILEFVKDKKIPVIFLAEKDNNDDETAAFTMGAADYSVRRHGGAGALISRIKLRICASECERRLLRVEGSMLSCSAAPETVLNNKTILVTDDLELNREIVAGMLSEIEGLTLEFAADGKEAIDKFAKDPKRYSLILMDVQMAGMDGLNATRAIRSLHCENARVIPIIALTASVKEDEIGLCLEAGMDDCIEKPMGYDKLLAVVAEHCL